MSNGSKAISKPMRKTSAAAWAMRQTGPTALTYKKLTR